MSWSFFFHFIIFFFYTDQVYFFRLLKNICNVYHHVAVFFIYIYFTSFFCSISLFFWKYLADKFLDIFIYMKKGYKKIIRNRYTRRFKNSTFNYNFVIIYITHKMLELLKNHLNFMKDSITKCFFKGYNRRSFSCLFIDLFLQVVKKKS